MTIFLVELWIQGNGIVIITLTKELFSFFYDAQFKTLGLKPIDDETKLKMFTVNDAMTDDMKKVTSGTIIIKCIKLNTEDEYDTLLDWFAIKCDRRTLLTIEIHIENENINVTFTENKVSSKLAEALQENEVLYALTQGLKFLDIKTITLKRMILIDFKVF